MADELTDRLRTEFRQHLERFYAELKLAPPYHSVEKALAQFATTFGALDAASRARIAEDRTLQWAEYAKAFVQSGLHLKHRGPIVGLIRTGQTASLPPEHRHFLAAYDSH